MIPTLKLHWLEPGEFRTLPMVRKADVNKGSFGHVLIVAGSLGKSGAALLGGRAALRVGAGLVTVATPANVLPIVAAGMPELMTAPLLATEEGTASLRNLDYDRFEQVVQGKSVLAMGPGLSTNDETQAVRSCRAAEIVSAAHTRCGWAERFRRTTGRIAVTKAGIAGAYASSRRDGTAARRPDN